MFHRPRPSGTPDLMKSFIYLCTLVGLTAVCSFVVSEKTEYTTLYQQRTTQFERAQQELRTLIAATDLHTASGKTGILQKIHANRVLLKSLDFWYRYSEPVMYRKLNGPLPVEWETEVFEKYEPPYRRTGAGLSLAEQYLDEPMPRSDSLLRLIDSSLLALQTFQADSITRELKQPQPFYFANRLFLLNLASVYTTGFECPDTTVLIQELRAMAVATGEIYTAYNTSFQQYPLSEAYLDLYAQFVKMLDSASTTFYGFDHYHMIRTYVEPLFRMNQALIRKYGFYSRSLVDYTLNDQAESIFNKTLYAGQQAKGIYALVDDEKLLSQIRATGKLLFYDPILSGNNLRSCASCHKSAQFFTDTAVKTALQYDSTLRLPRNTPSLVNVVYNHLLMLDGKHLTLQDQAKAVTTNPVEMGATAAELVKKVMQVPAYRNAFRKWMKYTPEEKEPGMDHIVAAITLYYSAFSQGLSPFDEAMMGKRELTAEQIRGFNLFMGKAQCGTCHFVPLFNGVKPPYTGSEFEILGVPADTAYHQLSDDKGRYGLFPHPETLHAFRTPTLRNIFYTAPYMHNGVFRTLDEVIHFYDIGGGAGKGLTVPGQTLSDAPLQLSLQEKEALKAFLLSLSESVNFETAPAALPPAEQKSLNKRLPGGLY